MPKKIKLSLDVLNVISFSTSNNDQLEMVKGGATGITHDKRRCTVDGKFCSPPDTWSC